MNKYIKSAILFAFPVVALSSCDDYLDTMPDNRTTLDSDFKIEKILTSAYSNRECCGFLELMSDNCDDQGELVEESDRWRIDTFKWKDEVEDDNTSASDYWEGAYNAIAATNEALEAMGANPDSEKMKQLRGEALLCRAYNHFMLGAIFCKAWTRNAANDLGLPYMDHSETELSPKYERGNLADFYNKVQADLEEGLKYVSDAYYSVPKYHFNVKAAWAFACRFYLYTEQWDKAISAANRCLGSEPSAMLRDYTVLAPLSATFKACNQAYIDASMKANLLLCTAVSEHGVMCNGAYGTYLRYNHTVAVASTEDVQARNIFGGYTMIRQTPAEYNIGPSNTVYMFKVPYLFEYTDPVAQIGLPHIVYPLFTADECLLNRAEAYIMTNRFDEAAADLTMWMKNFTRSTATLTPSSIETFYNSQKYSYEDEKKVEGTLKKHLNPAFTIGAEGSTQECMLQCMLGFRRMETLHHGLRWFDIKRYGIEIPRRLINDKGVPDSQYDWLAKDDPRRAVQIPLKVRDAGFEANPR